MARACVSCRGGRYDPLERVVADLNPQFGVQVCLQVGIGLSEYASDVSCLQDEIPHLVLVYRFLGVSATIATLARSRPPLTSAIHLATTVASAPACDIASLILVSPRFEPSWSVT